MSPVPSRTRVRQLCLAGGAVLTLVCAAPLLSQDVTQFVLHLLGRLRGSAVAESGPVSLRGLMQDGLMAGLAVVGVALLLPVRMRAARLIAQTRWRVGIAVSIAVVIQALGMWFRQSTLVGGRRIWFLADDAMISMRYGENLSAGHGLVWNIGERVEGYTNFAWTCFMAVVHWAGIGRDHASIAILLANMALCGALIVQMDRLQRALRVPPGFAFGGLLLCALSREIVSWSLSGLEVIALAWLATFAIAEALERGNRPRARAVAVIALLTLVRADAVVLALLVAVGAWLSGARRTASLFAIAAFLALAVHLLFRLSYYGDWLPNTAHLKVGQWAARWRHGVAYELAFAAGHFVALLLAAAAVVRRSQPAVRALGAIVALQFGYVWYIGGDAFAGARFLVPVLPLIFALAVVAAATVFERAVARRLALAALIVVTPLLFPHRFWWRAPAFFSALDPGGGSVENVELAEWLRAHTPPGAVIGDYWAGSVFYFSGRRGVDFLGKMDPVIARTRAVCDAGPPGHNKFDFDRSLGLLKPDYVVAGFKLHPDGTMTGPSNEPTPEGDLSGCRIFAALHDHPEFRSKYLPNVAGNSGWRTVFQRRD